MTIDAILIDIIILITVIGIALYIGYDSDSLSAGIITFLVGIIITGVIVGGELWYYNNSESGKRALKTQKSNYTGGITREVKIYDVNGKVIREYKGKFDIEYDDDRILFDDEKGNRHVIYYTTGTVIIDELKNK